MLERRDQGYHRLGRADSSTDGQGPQCTKKMAKRFRHGKVVDRLLIAGVFNGKGPDVPEEEEVLKEGGGVLG